MASELLNVQQPLASPDASLLRNTTQHRAHLHSDKFFNLRTKSSTSQHQVIYTRSSQSRRWLLIFGVMAKPWLACSLHGQPAASRPNCVTTTICSAAFLWCYPCRGFHMFTPPLPKTSRSVPITLSLFLVYLSHIIPLQLRLHTRHLIMTYVTLYNV